MSPAKKKPVRARKPKAPASASPSEFERDRRRLLFLCGEMIERIQAETEPTSIGPIVPLARDIDETDLAIKLGFRFGPLSFGHRWEPHFERVEFLIWHEPFGTDGGELIQRLVQVMKHHSGKEMRIPIERDQVKNRAMLIKALKAWIRAVEGLREPTVYPAMPPWVAADVDHRLWADPFWRAMHILTNVMRMRPNDSLAYYYSTTTEHAVGRINRLAHDAGLPSRLVFTRKGRSLMVNGPDGGAANVIDPDPLTALGEKTAESRETVIAILRQWQERRAENSLLYKPRALGLGRRPLAPMARQAAQLLLRLAPSEGMTAPDLATKLHVSVDYVKHEVCVALRPWIDNARGGTGYFIVQARRDDLCSFLGIADPRERGPSRG